MSEKYVCDNCEKITDKLYEVNDEGYCEKCFNHAITQAELRYESYREAEMEVKDNGK